MNTEPYNPNVDELLIDLEIQRQKGTPVTPEELCRNCPQLLEAVKQRIAEQVKTSQLLATPTGADTKPGLVDGAKENDVPTLPDLATQSRFGKIRFHAKGGLGEVWIGEDESLGRKVALKLIQKKHSHRDDALERFRREAEITSRLEHPGVVPVHSIGNAADGRPCYTMRFIEGETLQDAIRKFYFSPSPRGGEGTGVRGSAEFTSLAFRQLLRHFIDVCNTVAYAHSRGIIHRDLKPANIMLGSFGETWVLDWGLAKDLANPGHGDDANPAGEGGGEVQMTLGIGTPGYMAPEQIDGPETIVGKGTDIYALGAILYVLLTGEGPVSDKFSKEWLQRTRNGDYPRPRELNRAIPAALQAICLKARALKPEERFATATDLAAELERWLGDEPVAVHREQALVRARRWGRKHPGAVAALATTVLLGVVGLIVGYILMGQKNRQLSSANNRLDSANTQLTQSNADLTVARDDARRRYIAALDAFNQMVKSIQNKLEVRPSTQELRKDLLENARAGLTKLLLEAEKEGNPDQTLMVSYLRMGDVELVLGKTLEAQKEYQAGHELALRLAETDPKNAQAQRNLGVSYEKLGNVTLRLGQTKDALDFYQQWLQIAQRLADADPKNAQARTDLSTYYQRLGDIMLQLGQTRDALNFYQKNFQIAVRMLETDPKNALGISYEKLGYVTMRLGQISEARDFFDKSLRIFQRLAEADPQNTQAQRSLSVSFDHLGNVAVQIGQTKDALNYFERSLQVRQHLAEADPKNVQGQSDLSISYNNMGSVMLQLGQTKAALDFYQKSLQIFQRLAEADPHNVQAQRDHSAVYEKIGNVALQLGQTKDVLDFYQKYNQVAQHLAAADPNNADAQRDLSNSYDRLGNLTLQQGQFKDALDFYRKSFQVRQRLAQADPTNAQAQRGLSVSYHKLGDVTLQLGQTKDALDFHRKSLEIDQRLAEADAKNAQIQRDLGTSFERLGLTYEQLGQSEQALEMYRQMLTIKKRLAEVDPRDVVAQQELGITWRHLGEVTLQLGQTKAALESFQKSLEIAQRLAETDPKNAVAQRDLGVNYERLGNVTLLLGQTKDALDLYRKSLQIAERLAVADPTSAQGQRDFSASCQRLGNATLRLGLLKDALDFYQKSFHIDKRLAEADTKDTQAQRILSISYEKLGDVTLELGKTNDARDFYQQSLQVRQRLAEAKPKDAQVHTDLFVSYYKLGMAAKTDYDCAKAAEWFNKGRQEIEPLQKEGRLDAQQERWLTLAGREIAICQGAQKAIADIEFIFTHRPEAVPGMVAIRMRALLKRKQLADATVTAERFAAWAEKQEKDRELHCYNAACAFALCAATSDKPDALVEQAIALLTKSKAGGYFTPERIAHMKQDKDFGGIRQHPKFVQFAAELEVKK